MNLQAVKSTNIAAVGFDQESRTLRVLFQEGSMYDYFEVPASVYKALLAAPSKGQFFQQEIVGKMYRYEKSEERKDTMGKNKQQLANEQRAQVAAPKATQPVAEAPKPATPAPAAPAAAAQPTKQEQTIAKLLEGWRAKGVDLSKLHDKQDGKYRLLVVGEGWPTVQVGASGGITVLELRSYPDAFTAAMEGLDWFNKQKARDAKKVAAASAPAPAAPAPAPQPTPAAKKRKQHEAVEQQLQAQA